MTELTSEELDCVSGGDGFGFAVGFVAGACAAAELALIFLL